MTYYFIRREIWRRRQRVKCVIVQWIYDALRTLWSIDVDHRLTDNCRHGTRSMGCPVPVGDTQGYSRSLILGFLSIWIGTGDLLRYVPNDLLQKLNIGCSTWGALHIPHTGPRRAGAT